MQSLASSGTSVAFSPDAQTVAGGLGRDGRAEVGLWRTGAGTLLRTIPTGAASISTLAFSRDGTEITATGSAIAVYRLADGSLVRTFDQETGPLTTAKSSMMYSPRGQYFVYGVA